MQKKHSCGVRRASFPVENLNAVDFCSMICSRRRCGEQRLAVRSAGEKGRCSHAFGYLIHYVRPPLKGQDAFVPSTKQRMSGSCVSCARLPNLLERQSVDVLAVPFNTAVLYVPHMRVSNIGTFVRCAVYTCKTAER